jgi:gas vesicle protein
MTININNKLFYLLAGAAIGVLFAPKSGQEMRTDISDTIDDVKAKLQKKVQSSHITQDVSDTVSNTLKNVVERGRNVATIGRQRINESVEAGKRKFNESIESLDREDMASR